ncbi:MAG: NAD(P)H-hydrate dehydratase [Candidatus Omnitrophica bacterium]|nr:NAD(P)H-hydrate dehydratase [Candidatus Omnitrophota bacterium]
MNIYENKTYRLLFRGIAVLLIQALMSACFLSNAWCEEEDISCLSPKSCVQIPSFQAGFENFVCKRDVSFGVRKKSPLARPKVGVLVSSFNPITVSIEAMIEKAKKEHNLDKVILALTDYAQGDKVEGISLEQREKMLRLYIKGKPDYDVMLCEDTLYRDIGSSIKEKDPNADIYFVMGMNSFERMIDWQYQEKEKVLNKLFDDYNFIVAERQGRNLYSFLEQNPQYDEKYSGSLHRMSFDKKYKDVTSSLVRIHLKKGDSIEGLVPPVVQELIKRDYLYERFEKYAQGQLKGQTLVKYLSDMMASCKIKEGKGMVMDKAADEIERLLAQGSKIAVLSIGCGQAIELRVLKERFHDNPNITYMATDVNPDIIDEAKQAASGVHYNRRDIVDGDLSDLAGRFDVVLVVNVGHEVFNVYGRKDQDTTKPVDVELGKKYVRKTIENIKPLLKPHGHLLWYDGAEAAEDERDEIISIRFKNKDTRKKFYRFAMEFLPKKIRFKKIFFGLLRNRVKLSKQDFLRFVCEYLYVGDPRWEVEREESWQYYSIKEAVKVFSELGFTTRVYNFTPSRQAERWEKDIKILTRDADFPKIVLFLDARLDKDWKEVKITAEGAAFLMPQGSPVDFKNKKGKVLVVGGDVEYMGAVQLATEAAMRSGAGMAYGGVMKHLISDFNQAKLKEVMPVLLPYVKNGIWAGMKSLITYCYHGFKPGRLEKNKKVFGLSSAEAILENIRDKKISVLNLGPGLKTEKNPTSQMVYKLLRQAKIPIVLDAGGLNAIAKKPSVLRYADGQVVITPHLGEMSRLTGESIDYIKKHRHDTAREFAAAYNVVVVLKGDELQPTVIADPQGNLCVNTAGNRNMATAGTGDVLSGVISSLIGQGLSVYDAAQLGVYMHSRAADLASDEKDAGLIASDIIEYLPRVIKKLRQKREQAIHRDEKVTINRNKIKNVAKSYGLKQLEQENKSVPDEGYDSNVLILEKKAADEKIEKVVLRQSGWDRNGTLWEAELFKYLLSRDKGFVIPEIMLTRKGTSVYLEDEDIFTLYKYIQGDSVGLDDLTPQMKQDGAEFLAKLNAYTMDKRFKPLQGERITDTILEFNRIDKREEKLSAQYDKLQDRRIETLTPAEKFFVDNYSFFKKQIGVLTENLKPGYEKLPRCIIHGDFRPENVLYEKEKNGKQKIALVCDWDTAREEVRIYDVARSLFYDLNKEGAVFNIEELKKWVIDYQMAAQKAGYPLSEDEIRVIPEMLRARFIQQFIWLVRWKTMERIKDNPRELKFFENMAGAAKVLDDQDWDGFAADVLAVNKWSARNCFSQWKLVREIIEQVNSDENPAAVSVAEYRETEKRKEPHRVGIVALTSNPLHNTHLELINMAKKVELPGGEKLDEIIVLLGTKHVRKSIKGMSLEDRALTLKAALDELYEQGKGVPDKFLMVNTGLFLKMGEAIREYYKKFYAQEIESCFIVGVDAMKATLSMHSEEELAELFAYNKFVVMDREGKRIEDTGQYKKNGNFNTVIYPYKFKLPRDQMGISSTGIRGLVEEGKSVGKLIPKAVNSFIIETGVYDKDDNLYALRQTKLENMLRISLQSQPPLFCPRQIDKGILVGQAI